MQFAELGLTQDDERQIVALVASLPCVDKRIDQVSQGDDGTVGVWTGVLISDRAGCGDMIAVQKIDGVWQVVQISQWLA